ncbi:ATP synthase subunit I [Wielerella bovis]|uniref:ATP synthase subunit I n=1 Tax=Wielerella bovis TaxID=2917790 RepID=UPI002018B0D5|nr:ATP synthase subunit I [Wielerella bovis]MCG7656362.1 ATP synthase subunit I [Wielerella bovis]MCG7658587.1 ATP synthase subunit I [Wielerella bovis]ULJ62888.1 ATP synthase subunit I [Wielerella bovis]ULJ65118.1 ATP synthase subunit I [Wielerella bovis]ULJ67392.1 ATP synthase subunit I [Wielerella bovis]
MFAVVRLQFITLLLASPLCFVFYGFQAALSFALGCLSYTIPTVISVLILKLSRKQPELVGVGFVASEGLKIVLALILMTASVVLYKEIRFLPFFCGLLIVSHLILLYIMKVHHYGK